METKENNYRSNAFNSNNEAFNNEEDVMETKAEKNSSIAFNLKKEEATTQQKLRKGVVRIQIITHTHEFDKMQQEWDELMQQTDATAFQSFGWLNTWWHAFGASDDLYLIAFRDDEKLVGLAPMYREVKQFMGIRLLTSLRFIGSNIPEGSKGTAAENESVSDFLDVIAAPDYERDIARLLLHFFRRSADMFDKVYLQETSSNSWVQRVLIPEMKQEQWKYSLKQGQLCPILHLGTTGKDAVIDKFIQERKSRIQIQIGKLNRVINEQNKFNVNLIHTEEELDYYFPRLVELAQHQDLQAVNPGNLHNYSYIAFLHEALRNLLEQEQLWFTVVEIGDKVMACNVCLKQGDHIYELLHAADITAPYAQFRPGNIARFFVINEAMQYNYREFHFLREEQKPKNKLTKRGVTNSSVTLENPNNAGRFRKFVQKYIASEKQPESKKVPKAVYR